MAREVVQHPEFSDWLMVQSGMVQRRVAFASEILAEGGPQLGRPQVDTLYGSEFDNMKELRLKVGKAPYRLLFAFDPMRRAVLLLAGDKGKDKRWYAMNIPIADARFREHLAGMEGETGE